MCIRDSDKTLYDLFNTAAKKFADKPALGKRSATGYDWITYKQVRDDLTSLARTDRLAFAFLFSPLFFPPSHFRLCLTRFAAKAIARSALCAGLTSMVGHTHTHVRARTPTHIHTQIQTSKHTRTRTHNTTQAEEAAAKLASAAKKLGVERNARVGIFGQNSPEWMMAMQACNRQAFTCVPLYDTLGENAIEYICNHAEISLIFTADNKLAALNKV